MDIREKLLDLIIEAKKADTEDAPFSEFLADFMIANGVTVQEYAYWTEVVSVGDKICAHCSNCLTGHEARNYAALAIGHRHCRWCGARMLHKPPKGE